MSKHGVKQSALHINVIFFQCQNGGLNVVTHFAYAIVGKDLCKFMENTLCIVVQRNKKTFAW